MAVYTSGIILKTTCLEILNEYCKSGDSYTSPLAKNPKVTASLTSSDMASLKNVFNFLSYHFQKNGKKVFSGHFGEVFKNVSLKLGSRFTAYLLLLYNSCIQIVIFFFFFFFFVLFQNSANNYIRGTGYN